MLRSISDCKSFIGCLKNVESQKLMVKTIEHTQFIKFPRSENFSKMMLFTVKFPLDEKIPL